LSFDEMMPKFFFLLSRHKFKCGTNFYIDSNSDYKKGDKLQFLTDNTNRKSIS
jgi:hypothetical protein